MYIIRKTDTVSFIQYMEYDDKSYSITTRIKDILINNVHIYNEKYLPTVKTNTIPFNKIFDNLATKVFTLIYDDEAGDDDSAIAIMLGEVERIKSILESEYRELLKREEYYDYLDRITFLREELHNRLEINKYRRNLNSILANRYR